MYAAEPRPITAHHSIFRDIVLRMFDLYAHTARWRSAVPARRRSSASGSWDTCRAKPERQAERLVRQARASRRVPRAVDAHEQSQILVACIGSKMITEATFQHWSAVAQAESSSQAGHRPSAAEVTTQVMGFLISADWIIGEARDLDVHVSLAEVRRTFNRRERRSSPSRANSRPSWERARRLSRTYFCAWN